MRNPIFCSGSPHNAAAKRRAEHGAERLLVHAGVQTGQAEEQRVALVQLAPVTRIRRPVFVLPEQGRLAQPVDLLAVQHQQERALWRLAPNRRGSFFRFQNVIESPARASGADPRGVRRAVASDIQRRRSALSSSSSRLMRTACLCTTTACIAMRGRSRVGF